MKWAVDMAAHFILSGAPLTPPRVSWKMPRSSMSILEPVPGREVKMTEDYRVVNATPLEEMPAPRGGGILSLVGAVIILAAAGALVYWVHWAFGVVLAMAAVLAFISTRWSARRREMWHRVYGGPLVRAGVLTYIRHLVAWFIALVAMIPIIVLGIVALFAAIAVVAIIAAIALIGGLFRVRR